MQRSSHCYLTPKLGTNLSETFRLDFSLNSFEEGLHSNGHVFFDYFQTYMLSWLVELINYIFRINK